MDFDPRHKVHITAPINYATIGDAYSYQAGLGIGYTYPISDNWTLTPNASYGIAGSEELGTVAAIMSFSLTSRYDIELKGGVLSILNMVGDYSTDEVEIGDYTIDSDLQNNIFKNGISYEFDLNEKIAMTTFYTNTVFTGDELFSELYNELGASFSFQNTENSLLDDFGSIGFSYIFADESELNGARLNLGFKF
jgi:hypothetical protein